MKGRIWKQILALVLAGCMIFGDSAIGFAMESQPMETQTIDSGTCGENAFWYYDTEGVLKIEGVGAMTDYTKNSETPWYQYKDDIKKVVIGDEITSVGTYICKDFEAIEEIVLGVAVNNVGKYALDGTRPKKITVPNGEFSRGTYAFSVISWSSEVHDYFITVSIREDASAFNFYNSDIEAIQVIEAFDEDAPVNYAASDGVLYNADYSTLLFYPQRRQEQEYTVNEKTKNIDVEAFYGAYYLEKVNLPAGIEVIPEGTFAYCESLKEIKIPDTVSEIGMQAFYACESLKEIEIPDKVATIAAETFTECHSLENVVIGDGVTEIERGAFNCCYGIKTLKFGRNVANIGEAAFSHTSLVGEVSLDALSEDEVQLVSDTENPIIDEMLIPVKEVTMAEDSFEGVDARRVQLYSDTASGSDSVFFTFPGTESFEVLGLADEGAEENYAQRNGVLFDTQYKELVSYPKGRKDTEYRILEGTTKIHPKAFYNADHLERLYIPDSVEDIGAEAFAECDKLTIYCDADSYAAQYAEENGIPYSTQENNIEFTLLKKYSVVPKEDDLIFDDQIGDYDVVVTKDGERIQGCKVYRGNIVLPPDQVEAGDILEVHLSSKEGDTIDYTKQVTLDEKGYADEEFLVHQKGRCKITPTGADATSVLLFDMEGNRLESATCTTESFVSGFYDEGSYQLMVIYGEDGNWPFDTLAEFEENDYVGGDYTLKTIEITDNVVTDLGEVSVEKIDIMSVVYLDDDSCYFANTDVVSQNGLIQIKAEYRFQETEEEIIPKALRITLPENCSYVAGSMKVNGEFTDQVTETENEVVVSITDTDGTILFNLKPTDFGTIQSRAILEFATEKGELAATLGTIEVLAPYISLNTGTKTTEEEIAVSGVTSPETEVRIYDGAYLIGTTTSSKSGRWNTTVKLVNTKYSSVHDIKAVINEGTEEEKYSNTVNVFYEWSVKVTEFKVKYYYSGSFVCEWREKDLLEYKGHFLSFYPRKPVIFTVRLSDNEMAEKVYIVNTKYGTEELIEAEYSKAEDCWVAEKNFRKKLPGTLSVRVIEKKPEIIIDTNKEIIIDPSSVSEELKNAKYEEIINEFDEETGTGEYEGKITLADAARSEIGVKIAGEELKTDAVSEQKLLNDGYKKAESADGSSVYYSKLETLENGDVEFRTVEVGYDASDVIVSAIQTTYLSKVGDAVGTLSEEALGSVFGLVFDSASYAGDFLDEDGVYQKINQAYEYVTELYTNGQISKQEYSKKLDELIVINNKLLEYQTLKGVFFVAGGAVGFLCPVAALALSLSSSWISEVLDVDFELMFADFYDIQLRWIIDPSGYVYEAVPGNRLEDVTATIYYQEIDEGGNLYSICWDAEEYEQMNPLVTEADGVYAWDVPEGYWKVVFEKEGYESAETEWLPVPPMQTDINIGMVSKELTTAKDVTLYNEYAILTFDRYVQADSITSGKVKIVSEDGTECNFTVEAVEGAEQEGKILASVYRLIFAEKLFPGFYTVEICESIKDYADRSLKEGCTFTKEVKSTIKEIKAELPKQIVMGVECTIPITVVTEGNLKDYDIEFVSEAENAFYVLDVSGADENGTFNVKIDPNLPVQVNLDVYVDGLLMEEIPLEILINEMPMEPEKEEVIRLYGATRYETGYKVADALKEKLKVDQFNAVIVATGKNFADALAGSYLSVVKNAPILLTNGKSDNIATLHEYINSNVKVGGIIYILGGNAAVPKTVESIEGYTIKRLSGNTRYDTNIEILKEAGMAGDSVIVATGKSFADSLSASAAKLPILLVKPGSTLSSEQKALLDNVEHIYIVGGEGAVAENYVSELSAYGEVERVYGASRYDTSVAVANTFFEDVDVAVVASGKNFPDGLCGGSLAAAMDAPLILTADGKTTAAANYMQSKDIGAGYVLGGTGALSDVSVVDVFGLGSVAED